MSNDLKEYTRLTGEVMAMADGREHTPAPETHLVPSIERLADLIDDAAPGAVRFDTRWRIASHIRAALAAEGRE